MGSDEDMASVAESGSTALPKTDGLCKSQIERAARAIATSKRGAAASPEVIDRVWPSYAGQARAAMVALNAELVAHDLLAAGRMALQAMGSVYEGFAPGHEPGELPPAMRALRDAIAKAEAA